MSIISVEAKNARFYIQLENHHVRNVEGLFEFIEKREGQAPSAYVPEIQPLPIIGETRMMAPQVDTIEREFGNDVARYLERNKVDVYFIDVPARIGGVDDYQTARRWGASLLTAAGLGLLGFKLHGVLREKYPDSFLFRDRSLRSGEVCGSDRISRRNFLERFAIGLGLGAVTIGQLADPSGFPSLFNTPNLFSGEEGLVRRGLRRAGERMHGIAPSWTQEGRSAVLAERLDGIVRTYEGKPVIALNVGATHGQLDRYLTDVTARKKMLSRYSQVIGNIDPNLRDYAIKVSWKGGVPTTEKIASPIID